MRVGVLVRLLATAACTSSAGGSAASDAGSVDGASDDAAGICAHLKAAKVTRARLSEDSATTMGINFRSWRDSGITWLALDDVDVAKMMRRAGHDNITTTMGYVKMAEDVFGIVGAPFPNLPKSLVSPTDRTNVRTSVADVELHLSVIASETSCEGRELNQRPESARSGEKKAEASAEPGEGSRETRRASQASEGPSKDLALREAEPTETEIETAIVRAMLAGLGTVAEQLTAQLKARRERTAPNVVRGKFA